MSDNITKQLKVILTLSHGTLVLDRHGAVLMLCHRLEQKVGSVVVSEDGIQVEFCGCKRKRVNKTCRNEQQTGPAELANVNVRDATEDG